MTFIVYTLAHLTMIMLYQQIYTYNITEFTCTMELFFHDNLLEYKITQPENSNWHKI